MTRIHEELIKLNLHAKGNTRAIVKLADRLEHLVVDHKKELPNWRAKL